MKKVLILLSVMALVFTFSFGVMADETDPWDGLFDGYNDAGTDGGDTSWYYDLQGSTYNIVDLENRNTYTKDINGDDQNASVKITTEAYIPCYNEIIVTGNQSQGTAKTYGPNATAELNKTSNWFLTFDNEIGGFVDDNWSSIGHGYNAEVDPDTAHYIQACDIMEVKTYANDTYKYQVESKALSSVDADTTVASEYLNLEMRTYYPNDTEQDHTFNTVDYSTKVIRTSIPATVEKTFYHQFRVPYNRNVAHGKYTGRVIFRVVTI